MTKKKIFTIAGIAVGAVIVIGIVIWLIFFRGGSVAPSDPNEMVYVTSVADITGTGSLGMTAKYSGVVEPEKTLSVQKDDTKKIAELYVTVGQEVKVGDKLFSYDTDDLQMQLEEAQLQLESLKNRISTLNQQIDSLQKEKNKASSDEQLSYTLQIQSAQLEVKSTEYDQSTKAKEIENLKKSLENTDVVAEMAGVVKQINDGSNTNTSGSDSTNAYITILATGSYRVKGTATELNVYSLQEGMKMKGRLPRRSGSSNLDGHRGRAFERDAANDNNNMQRFLRFRKLVSQRRQSSSLHPVRSMISKVSMLGQHVYVEPDKAEDVKTGNLAAKLLYSQRRQQELRPGDVNDKNRIEKREVQLGKFDDTLSEYEITSGVTADDRLAVVEDRVQQPGRTLCGTNISYKNQGDDSKDMDAANGDRNDAKTDDANGGMPAEDGSDMDGDPNGYSAMPAEGAVTESEGETDTADGATSSFETVIGGATA